jgi:hypothetical protein
LTNARDVLFHRCELSQPPQTGKNRPGSVAEDLAPDLPRGFDDDF